MRVGLWRRPSAEELMLLNCGVGEDSWESLGLQGDPTHPFYMRSVLGVHWKDWCWSWNSNTLAIWCEELTHWKRPWCWEGLGAGREGDDRGWDGWMASPTWWTWVWVNSKSWWWTGRPGVLQFMGLQSWTRLSDWTELNWLIHGTTFYPRGIMLCLSCVWLISLSVMSSRFIHLVANGRFSIFLKVKYCIVRRDCNFKSSPQDAACLVFWWETQGHGWQTQGLQNNVMINTIYR